MKKLRSRTLEEPMPAKCRPTMLEMRGPRIALRLLTGRMDPETISEEDTRDIGLLWHRPSSLGSNFRTGTNVRPKKEAILEAAEELILHCLSQGE